MKSLSQLLSNNVDMKYNEIVDLLNKVSDWVESAEFNHTESY